MNSSKLIKLPPVLLRINRDNKMRENDCQKLNRIHKPNNLSKVWDRVLAEPSG